MMQKLTSKKFWEDYWSAEKIEKMVRRKPYFADLIKDNLPSKARSFIEIGGFPGIYAYYVTKELGITATLLDYVLDKKVILRIANHYGLKRYDVNLIEADFFKYSPKRKYDLVFSSGFIEHFDDTKDVVTRHLRYLGHGGKLLITIPNYLGINGLMQKIFDPEHYRSHNLSAMDIDNLQIILAELHLKSYKIVYYGNSGVWFENLEDRGIILKMIVAFFYLLKYPLGILRVNTKTLSPHIVIQASKI